MGISQLTYLIAQVSLAVFNWLILTIIAKKFDKTLVGNYSLVLAWLTPIFLLFSLQIKNRILTTKSENYTDLINLRFHLILPLIVVCSFVTFINLPSTLALAIFLIKLGEYIFEMPFVMDQKADKLLFGSIVQLSRNCLVYIFVIVLIYLNFSFIQSLMIGGSISVFIGILYAFYKKVKLKWRVRLTTLSVLIPLGISASLLSFSVSVPRIFLKSLVGIEQVAIYTVIFSFYSIWQMLFNNYFTGFLNRMQTMKIKEYLYLPLIVFGISALIFYNFDTLIYELLFGSGFKVAANYTIFLLANILLSFFSSLMYYKLLAQNNYNSHLWINIITFILSLILMYLFIKQWGIEGALIAQAIVQCIQLILYKRVLNE